MQAPDPTAFLLAALAASILPAYLLRVIDRLEAAQRMRRCLRMAIGREIDLDLDRGFAPRRLRGRTPAREAKSRPPGA